MIRFCDAFEPSMTRDCGGSAPCVPTRTPCHNPPFISGRRRCLLKSREAYLWLFFRNSRHHVVLGDDGKHWRCNSWWRHTSTVRRSSAKLRASSHRLTIAHDSAHQLDTAGTLRARRTSPKPAENLQNAPTSLLMRVTRVKKAVLTALVYFGVGACAHDRVGGPRVAAVSNMTSDCQLDVNSCEAIQRGITKLINHYE